MIGNPYGAGPLSLPPFVFFPHLGLAADTADSVLWRVCQERQLVLLTANRNHDGPDSLEATIRAGNTPDSLPVLTVSNAQRLQHSRDYVERVVEQFLDYLLKIEQIRGKGRLYLP